MNQCRVLIVIAQLFFVFAKPGQSLAVRSPLIDAPDVLQVKKRFKRYATSSADKKSPGMTCDGNKKRVGDPADCFNALQYIYDNRPTSGCAVAGSCAMMPLNEDFTNLIAPGTEPPYSFEQVAASYNGLFKYYCKGYHSPRKFSSKWPTNAFNSGFLLGANGASEPSECSSDMAEQIMSETKAYSGP